MAAVPSALKKGLADGLITCITGLTPQVCPLSRIYGLADAD